MFYDKEKTEHYEGEPSGTKPYLMNTGVSTRPPIPSHTAILANYRWNLRINEDNACTMGTMAGFRLNVSIANYSGHFKNRVRFRTMIALNTWGQASPRRDANNAGGQYTRSTMVPLPQ